MKIKQKEAGGIDEILAETWKFRGETLKKTIDGDFEDCLEREIFHCCAQHIRVRWNIAKKNEKKSRKKGLPFLVRLRVTRGDRQEKAEVE